MKRISWKLALCAALLCGLSAMASASRMTVNVDLNTRNTPVTLSVQDMDVTEVLSILFNAAGDKYQLQTGVGVSGKIDALQLTQTPFDDAMKAILAKVGTSYTFSKEDGDIYRVSNTASTAITSPTPTLYLPAVKDDSMTAIKVTLPLLVSKNAKSQTPSNNSAKPASAGPAGPPGDASDPNSLLGDPTAPTGDKTGKDDKPTTEECYLAVIKIHFQPAHVFAVGFGAEELPDFSTLTSSSTTSSTTGSTYSGLNSTYGANSAYGTNYNTTSSTSGSYVNGVYYPYGTTSGTTTSSSGTVTIGGVTYTPTTSTTTTTTTGKTVVK